VNCHPAGDVPLQGDDGHLHEPPITRGPRAAAVAGVSCSTCHGKQKPAGQLRRAHAARRVHGLAPTPPTTAWSSWGLDSKALCEQIKDRKRNGGKSLAELTHHMTEDALTLWGWSPGYGRKPVAISHDQFARAYRTWAERGHALCDTNRADP